MVTGKRRYSFKLRCIRSWRPFCSRCPGLMRCGRVPRLIHMILRSPFCKAGRPVSGLDSKIWKRALKKATIQNFRWHGLRHTWASWLVQRGVPLVVLKEMGGWEKPDMVMRYAYLPTEHLLPNAGTLDQLGDFGHKMDTKSTRRTKKKA